MNNHDVMNKIVKYDMAARKQAALQMSYSPQDDSINTADEMFSESNEYDSDGEKKAPVVSFYCKHTRYAVIREAGKV